MERQTNTQSAPIRVGAQVVDPSVSLAKFEKELSLFQSAEKHHRQRGVSLVWAEFPSMVLTFSAYRLRPLSIVFAVKLDFTNYDLDPISVKFIDPISEAELRKQELYTHMHRKIPIPGANTDVTVAPTFTRQELIQSHEPDHIPFLCLPGVREYHAHSVHSNDPWLNRRGKGEGTLGFIIDQLVTYGTEPISGVTPKTVNIAMLPPGTMQVQYNGIIFMIDKTPL
ncbi:putative metal binding uncharacterized protein [Lacibacter cauensis]|uniref:Putative metal binding uncharacterized protein n=1 Tax=Lacibacter cauensis TaxID=510947 RepID=A0A562SBC4_9BACT|nr:putative metal-binding protein [Lacibacter cauensis]TWI77950.1 putative metal binding uncharacterized protein [Lacibacter cauensis]